MAKMEIREGALHISIGLFESVRALQRSFSVPLAQVRGATDDNNIIREGLGIRSPGTGFPGLVAEGTFLKQGQRTLSLWRRKQEIAVIELQDSKWDRVLLGCKNSKEIANKINQVLK
jgi:hypothetical protein